MGDHLAFAIPAEVPDTRSFERAFPPDERPALDWIGVNYYTRWRLKYAPRSAVRVEFHTPPGPRGDNGWAIAPEGFERAIREVAAVLPGTPLLVTENGLADAKDDRRPAFLRDHLAILDRVMTGRSGKPPLDVRGYYHWSLTDNFEWLEGYRMRFGLVAIDYDRALARVPRPSARVYANAIMRRSSDR